MGDHLLKSVMEDIVLMETNMALFSSLGLWTMALMGRRCVSYCLLLFHTSTSSCILPYSFHGSCHRKIWLATVNEWNAFSFNTAPVSFKIIHFVSFIHGNYFIFYYIPPWQLFHSLLHCWSWENAYVINAKYQSVLFGNSMHILLCIWASNAKVPPYCLPN